MKVVFFAGLVLLLVPAVQAQQPPETVTCEQDPTQNGCDPACATGMDCDHPPCPTGLAGYAPQTGGVFMSWTLNSFTDVKVYRSQGGEPFEPIARLEFPATRHIDLDTEAGATYTYQVSAVAEDGSESPRCGQLEVTTVPVFPPLLGMAAVGVALLGYALLRR